MRLRRPPWWLLVGTVAGVAAVVALLVWPSGGGAARTTALRVADVPAAVRALETRLGGAQRYTEIKAGTEGVSMFVAGAAGGEAVWFYRAGDLQGPGASDAPSGLAAFALDGVALDKADDVARAAMTQFPTADLEQFALLELPDAGVVWSLSLRSARGGQIDVTFSPTGEPMGAELR